MPSPESDVEFKTLPIHILNKRFPFGDTSCLDGNHGIASNLLSGDVTFLCGGPESKDI